MWGRREEEWRKEWRELEEKSGLVGEGRQELSSGKYERSIAVSCRRERSYGQREPLYCFYLP